MRNLIASTAAALLVLSPLAASADSALVLQSTKSTGNLNAGVGDDVVVAQPVPVAAGGGLGTAGYIALGVGALALAAIIANDDDDDDNSSSSTTDANVLN